MDVVASKALVLCSYCRNEMKRKQLKENTEKNHGKNPAHRKERISRPMLIVAPIFVIPLPLWKGLLAINKVVFGRGGWLPYQGDTLSLFYKGPML